MFIGQYQVFVINFYSKYLLVSSHWHSNLRTRLKVMYWLSYNFVPRHITRRRPDSRFRASSIAFQGRGKTAQWLRIAMWNTTNHIILHKFECLLRSFFWVVVLLRQRYQSSRPIGSHHLKYALRTFESREPSKGTDSPQANFPFLPIILRQFVRTSVSMVHWFISLTLKPKLWR